jgi:hypothetical protein
MSARYHGAATRLIAAKAIDATMIESDASRGRKIDGKPATWPDKETITRPVREHLDALDQDMRAACLSGSSVHEVRVMLRR